MILQSNIQEQQTSSSQKHDGGARTPELRPMAPEVHTLGEFPSVSTGGAAVPGQLGPRQSLLGQLCQVFLSERRREVKASQFDDAVGFFHLQVTSVADALLLIVFPSTDTFQQLHAERRFTPATPIYDNFRFINSEYDYLDQLTHSLFALHPAHCFRFYCYNVSFFLIV